MIPQFRTLFNIARDPLTAANALRLQPGVHVVGQTEDTMLTPARPMVLAYNSATDTNVTGNGTGATVDFDTEVVDAGADFSGDTFTAPVTGRYSVGGTVDISDLTVDVADARVAVVTSNRTYVGTRTAGVNATALRLSYCIPVADMDAGDTLTVVATVSGMAGDTADITGNATALLTFVAIHLVG